MDKYRNLNRYIKVTCYLSLCLLMVVLTIFASGIRFGYKVTMDGKNIAVVESKDIIPLSVKAVENKVLGQNVKKMLSNPEYDLTLTLNSDFENDREAIANKIIKASDNIVYGIKATINGETYIFESKKKDIVEDYLSKYDLENTDSKSEFVDDVKIENGYFLRGDINKRVGINTVLSSLCVKTVANVTTCSEIAYKTISVPTGNLVKGTSQVQCEGENGTEETVERVTYLNGTETERTLLSSKVTNAPVNRVVLVGTSVSTAQAQSRIAAQNCGFAFPIKDSYKLGDPFGDGRKHKGYDILANSGTAIHASKEGTVIRSGWYGGYGYCVEIDHGNGYVTRYGHASALLCSVGQKVSAGEVIAKVGSTGNSTGNHVHFEIIKNGKQVDPAPYLNIN